MIVWLEDPSEYRYLRKGNSPRCHRMENQWKKGVKLNCEDFYKLVGYEFRGKAAGVCLYDIYWLKTYDFGCPEGNTGPYKDYPNNHPSEAVEVSELLGEAILT